MNLYLDNGYLDVAKIINRKTPFDFVIGGRGTGKTYGAIKYVLDNKVKFIYIRRTQAQVEKIANNTLNPFKDVDDSIIIDKVPGAKGITGVYREDKKHCLGYIAALSTFSALRGFSAKDVDILIWDEFIGEAHERPIKNEALTFLNAVETIARNRELENRPPLKVLCLANSNKLVNPVFIELQLVSIAEKMNLRGLDFYEDPGRGYSIYILRNSPISEKKRQTALYKLTAGVSMFGDMATENNFNDYDTDSVTPLKLANYKPLCRVGELTIYKHRSEEKFYITDSTGGRPQDFSASVMDLKRWRRQYAYLWYYYMCKDITFEKYYHKAIFETYFDIAGRK